MRFFILVLFLFWGCAAQEVASGGKITYRKYIDKYNITVTIHRDPNGLCLAREVILDHDVGLRFNSGDSPSYVRALDVNCDEVFDLFIFRDPVDKERTNFYALSQKLNYYFYRTAPIEEHVVQK